MNKKVLAFVTLSFFALTLVNAGLVTYISQTSQGVSVSSAVTGTGSDTSAVTIVGGEYVTSNPITLTSVTSVNAPVDIATLILPDDTGFSSITNYMLDNSEGTCDNYPAEGWREDCEKRISLDAPMDLSSLTSISWNADISLGYAPHVDVILDNGKSLTFEYATIDSDCNAPSSYPTGEINTFGDMGSISDTSYAWTDLPGPCGDSDFDAQHLTLADWKTTYPTAKIVRFDVEIDNWISASNSSVGNILVNGNSVNDLILLPSSTLKFEIETTADVAVSGEYTIITEAGYQ